MRWLLLAVGVLVAYEAVARMVQYSKRYSDSDEDARLHRVRVLNQRGQPPNEINY